MGKRWKRPSQSETYCWLQAVFLKLRPPRIAKASTASSAANSIKAASGGAAKRSSAACSIETLSSRNKFQACNHFGHLVGNVALSFSRATRNEDRKVTCPRERCPYSVMLTQFHRLAESQRSSIRQNPGHGLVPRVLSLAPAPTSPQGNLFFRPSSSPERQIFWVFSCCACVFFHRIAASAHGNLFVLAGRPTRIVVLAGDKACTKIPKLRSTLNCVEDCHGWESCSYPRRPFSDWSRAPLSLHCHYVPLVLREGVFMESRI